MGRILGYFYTMFEADSIEGATGILCLHWISWLLCCCNYGTYTKKWQTSLKENYGELTLAELKSELRARNEKVSGRKSELVQR